MRFIFQYFLWKLLVEIYFIIWSNKKLIIPELFSLSFLLFLLNESFSISNYSSHFIRFLFLHPSYSLINRYHIFHYRNTIDILFKSLNTCISKDDYYSNKIAEIKYRFNILNISNYISRIFLSIFFHLKLSSHNIILQWK